jgi:hypothetical protein
MRLCRLMCGKAPPYRAHGFASKVRLFKISFTPGFSPVIGSWKKFAKPF